MTRVINNRKKESLAKLPNSIIANSKIELRCKFNFSYFDSTPPSCGFSDWDFENLSEFLNKLQHFGKEPLKNWIKSWEKHNSPLEIYDNFPPKNKTEFSYPKNVPADVKWARFRLNSKVRLIGFIIPDELHNTSPKGDSEFLFDKNTFYVVFLDLQHKFWISELKNT